MNVKHLITHFIYRIEPKPEGGFIAHATDPTVPPLEAATREELQRKIQENIAASLASEFPGLKLPLEKQGLQFAFHIEGKPGGGFSLHSADPGAQPIEAATHEEIENHFAEKLMAFVGQHLMPDLSRMMAAQGNPEAIKILENAKLVDAKEINANFGSVGGTIENSPIAPETSSGGPILRFLLTLLIIFALMYFFLHRR